MKIPLVVLLASLGFRDEFTDESRASLVSDIKAFGYSDNLPVSLSAYPCIEKTKIGEVDFGNVFSGITSERIGELPSGTRVAIKEEKLEYSGKKFFSQEVKTLLFFKGKERFLQMYSWGIDKDTGYIITELGINSVGKYLLYHSNELPLEKKISIVKRVIEGIIEMHDNNFVHLDLKWDNVLYFDEDFNIIKLADFGLSQNNNIVLSQVCSSFMRAPELKRLEKIKKCYGKPLDIYSLGKMIHQIFGPFDVFESPYRHKYIFNSLTNENPKLRPTAREVLDLLDKFAAKVFEDQ
jgi:serine/threonine protein kinase